MPFYKLFTLRPFPQLAHQTQEFAKFIKKITKKKKGKIVFIYCRRPFRLYLSYPVCIR